MIVQNNNNKPSEAEKTIAILDTIKKKKRKERKPGTRRTVNWVAPVSLVFHNQKMELFVEWD